MGRRLDPQTRRRTLTAPVSLLSFPTPRAVARCTFGLLKAAAVVCLAACAQQAQEPEPEPAPSQLPAQATLPPSAQVFGPGEAKVAILLPLSGPAAPTGKAVLNAAEMALFELAGPGFQLVIKDTGGTPEGAAQAAQEAVFEGAQLILGPLFSTSAQAAAPIALGGLVPMISFSNDMTLAQNGVYVLGITPDSQIDRVIGYAVTQGSSRFALLAPENSYGQATLDALTGALGRHGGTMISAVFYPPGTTDVSAQVKVLAQYEERRAALLDERRKLAARNDPDSQAELERLMERETLGDVEFDSVLIPAGGRELLLVAPLLPFYDVDPEYVRFLGTRLWDDGALGTEPSLVGGWFATPDRRGWQAFSQRYQAHFGVAPPRVASLGYDSTALAAVLTRQAEAAGQAVVFDRPSLTQPDGFAGVDGIFRFRPDGTPERGLSVQELQRGKILERAAAPSSFAGAIY